MPPFVLTCDHEANVDPHHGLAPLDRARYGLARRIARKNHRLRRLCDKFSSEKRRELADSARDVRKKLRDRGIESTDDRDDADVLVVILDRRIEVHPSGENDWGGALKQTHYQSRHILSVRYETGATIEASEVALAGAFVTWKRVAGEVAKDAEKWARDNRP